ncbi:aspartate-semialdehyde dehydrogenase [Fictibacillus phosphorivorans]|uniref:aspartate-semialdehyde dehydrogenase n=1 Tax=Fictibacillus phosphorivorans TaxID=1221500 RepID=UPI00203D601F|nr:aspartate-semialdehyde dehydrogenase [Fictibacillus phosphorivorans]MCM3717107.1 aspartate-semialdehyde dehydrogenase [Fictibacillus phosphorivorans]MCM3774794.1 aspartate-semialdehyde dehydrogenase [Fictibacillus phosphorivorans]
MSQKSYHVAVVGATGAVGQQMLNTLIEKNFPIGKLSLLASKRSAGQVITYKGESHTIQEATPEAFEGVDLALFSAGGSVSKALAHEAVKRGAIVVDNTSAFRMDPNVPLVVPEVNEQDLLKHNGIIANPNCSTIQMVVALQPLHEKYGLKKVIVSTYQAVSGAGAKAVEELKEQSKAILNDEPFEASIMPCASDKKHYQIAFNAVPQIDKFEENGYTFEELKMMNETKKIMHLENLEIAATCVRLPVETGHSESLYAEFENGNPTVEEIKEVLKSAPGITLQDQPEEQIYPMPSLAAGLPDVFVGRIRKDLDRDNAYHMWVVSDNLLKGAAYNSVQIAESLIKLNLL